MAQTECPNCGAMNPAGSGFCGECGQSLPAAGSATDAPRAPVADPGNFYASPPSSQGLAQPLDAEPLAQPAGEFEGEGLPAGEISRPPAEALPAAPPGMAPPELDQSLAPELALPEPAPVAPLEGAPYYAGPLATVTAERVVFGSRSYQIGDIQSAAVTVKPARRLPSILLAVLGGAVTLAALLDPFQDSRLGLLFTVGGLILLGIGILLSATARAMYAVQIQTAEGTEDVLDTPDRVQAEESVAAIQTAIGAGD